MDGFSDLAEFRHVPDPEPELSSQIPAFDDEPSKAVEQHAQNDAAWTPHWKCVICESTNWIAVSSGWQCECGSTEFYRPWLPSRRVTDTGTWLYMGMKQLHHLHRPRSLQEEGIDVDDSLVEVSLQTWWKVVSKLRRKFWHMIHRLSQALLHPFEIMFLMVIVPKEVHQFDIILQPKEVLKPKAASEYRNLQGHHWLLEKGVVVIPWLQHFEKDDDGEWNSRKGPEPGIRWRMGQHPQPPSWKYDQFASGRFRCSPTLRRVIRPCCSMVTGDAEQELLSTFLSMRCTSRMGRWFWIGSKHPLSSEQSSKSGSSFTGSSL